MLAYPPETSSQLIYVVDDDELVCQLVATNLENYGFRTRQFNSGTQVLSQLETEQPDLIILDILMPEPDGLVVAQEIRRFSQVPIVMLSVVQETSAKLTALDLGADDYITKPFEMEEVVARVRAVLRRSGTVRGAIPLKVYCSGELRVDLENLRVSRGDQNIPLTQHEWAVLRALVRHVGQVVSAEQILLECWGPDYVEERDYVRAYIARLRRKLEPNPAHPTYILLERGIGYRLAPPG